MKELCEMRYFVTDIVAVPIAKLRKKSDAYKEACKPGLGTVDTDGDNELVCNQDSFALLVDEYGRQCGIYPYEELNSKEWHKQAECKLIIIGNGCGFDFWEDETGLAKIYVTYDESGFIDTFRITDWTDQKYDGETLIAFEDLPSEDPYHAH